MSQFRIKSALFIAAGFSSPARSPHRAQAQTGLQFFAVTPCRAADTRTGFGGILPASTLRNFTIKTVCGVPAHREGRRRERDGRDADRGRLLLRVAGRTERSPAFRRSTSTRASPPSRTAPSSRSAVGTPGSLGRLRDGLGAGTRARRPRRHRLFPVSRRVDRTGFPGRGLPGVGSLTAREPGSPPGSCVSGLRGGGPGRLFSLLAHPVGLRPGGRRPHGAPHPRRARPSPSSTTARRTRAPWRRTASRRVFAAVRPDARGLRARHVRPGPCDHRGDRLPRTAGVRTARGARRPRLPRPPAVLLPVQGADLRRRVRLRRPRRDRASPRGARDRGARRGRGHPTLLAVRPPRRRGGPRPLGHAPLSASHGGRRRRGWRSRRLARAPAIPAVPRGRRARRAAVARLERAARMGEPPGGGSGARRPRGPPREREGLRHRQPSDPRGRGCARTTARLARSRSRGRPSSRRSRCCSSSRRPSGACAATRASSSSPSRWPR